jgi:hypothetical protein
MECAHLPCCSSRPSRNRVTYPPLGQKYFYSPARQIATESNLRDPATPHLIVRAAGQVDSLLAASQLPLPNSSELMLDLEQIIDHDGPSCKYYFMDHVKRAVFWLEHTNTGILQLPPVTSVSHLSTSPRFGHHKTRLLISAHQST